MKQKALHPAIHNLCFPDNRHTFLCRHSCRFRFSILLNECNQQELLYHLEILQDQEPGCLLYPFVSSTSNRRLLCIYNRHLCNRLLQMHLQRLWWLHPVRQLYYEAHPQDGAAFLFRFRAFWTQVFLSTLKRSQQYPPTLLLPGSGSPCFFFSRSFPSARLFPFQVLLSYHILSRQLYHSHLLFQPDRLRYGEIRQPLFSTALSWSFPFQFSRLHSDHLFLPVILQVHVKFLLP